MKGINLNKKYTKFIFIFILIILLIGGYKVYTRYRNKIIDYKQVSIHINNIEKRLSGESTEYIIRLTDNSGWIKINEDATGNKTYYYSISKTTWTQFEKDQRIPKPTKDRLCIFRIL